MIEATPTFELLFSEFALGPLKLRNRIVGLPHATARVTKGVPSDDDIAYWEARAAGGAGMLTIGGSIVHPTTAPPNRWLSEIWNPAAFAQMERRAAAIHEHGAAVVTQLVHLGREALGQGDFMWGLLAPSALRSPRTAFTPHPMTKAEIEELIAAFVGCSVNLRNTGHDGVELHAAHGYLVAQFLSADANRRADEYGGDLAGRMRFLEEVIAGIRRDCGSDFLVSVRISADEEYPEGMHLEHALEIVRRLERVAPADYFNITVGMRGAYVKDVTQPLGVAVAAASAVKRATTIPVLVGSRIVGAEMAEGILRREAADLIGMARALVVDPDWVKKSAAGELRSIRPCLELNQECRSFPGGILCASSARVGRERWFAEQLALPRRSGVRLAVVGGGPAGLEAARFAAELGARVVLHERDRELGGQLRLAAKVKSRAGVFGLIPHLEHEARRFGVEIRLGSEATAQSLAAEPVDAVIVATGARPLEPSYQQDEGAQVITVWRLLAGDRPPGERALVVDDGSGFWEAVSAAELLGDEGFAVHLATPSAAIGGAIPFESAGPLLRRLAERRVAFHPLSRVARVLPGRVVLTHVLTGDATEVEADQVAGHAGYISDDALVDQLTSGGGVVRTIGDCVSPRRLSQANWEADRTVLELLRAGAELRPAARAW
jgi:2,4-dienoyl-CoA reductase (NADPH2)